MPYCTLADLNARAGEPEILQIADRDGDGAADPEVIEAAVAAAGVEIDTRLGGRYALPLDPVPAIVKSWAVSIARYVLHRDGPPDHVVRDQRDAISGLKEAQAGNLVLPSTTGAQPAAPTTGGMGVGGDRPMFTDHRLSGFL